MKRKRNNRMKNLLCLSLKYMTVVQQNSDSCERFLSIKMRKWNLLLKKRILLNSWRDLVLQPMDRFLWFNPHAVFTSLTSKQVSESKRERLKTLEESIMMIVRSSMISKTTCSTASNSELQILNLRHLVYRTSRKVKSAPVFRRNFFRKGLITSNKLFMEKNLILIFHKKITHSRWIWFRESWRMLRRLF